MLGKSEIRPSSRPRDGCHCDLCGCSQPAVRCDKCGCQIFCLSCDDMYHRHPKRRFHLRRAVDQTPPVAHARPVLPAKASQLASNPGDPSKMPLPPPRKKKPVKSFFDTFRKASPSSDNSPPLPKKEYSWTDRLGSIKKFMSNRPLPPLPNNSAMESSHETSANGRPTEKDLSFIHKRVDEKPPQLPQRSVKPPVHSEQPWQTHFDRENRNGTLDSTQLQELNRNDQWSDRRRENQNQPHNFATLGPQNFPPQTGHGYQMHFNSASATDLHTLPDMEVRQPPGLQPHQYPQYILNPHLPPHYPYPVYPQYPTQYPPYFGNSFVNLSGNQTADGDFSDQSDAHRTPGKRYHSRKRAKRSQSVVADRMAYPGHFYPFGPYPPGYGPGQWLPPPSMVSGVSPAGSSRSLNRVGRSRHLRKTASRDEDESSVSSSPMSRPKSSSSELLPGKQRNTTSCPRTTSSGEGSDFEDNRENRHEQTSHKNPPTPPMSSPASETSRFERKRNLKPKKVKKLKSDVEQDASDRKVSSAEQSDDHQAGSMNHWQCSHCTFINPVGSRICQACCKTNDSVDGSPSLQDKEDSEKNYPSPDKEREEEEEENTSRRNKQDMDNLNSALDEAEKEITRGLEELLKLKDDPEQPDKYDEPQSHSAAENTEPAKPVYKSSGRMRKSILDKLNLSSNNHIAQASVSTDTQTEQTHGTSDKILEARRPSTSSTTSETFNSPTARTPELQRRRQPDVQAGSKKDSSCQTQQDALMQFLERKRLEEEMYFGRPSKEYGFGDRARSPLSPTFGGFRLGQRSHSRASLFAGGRMNETSDLGNSSLGFGHSPMYRSVSRSSLTGDYSDTHLSDFRNLRKPEFYLSMEELVERRRQETIRVQGLELVRMIREAEQRGFTADDIQVALNNCGKNQTPMEWLEENWKDMVDNVITLSTNYGNDKKENDIGVLSEIEAIEALRLHKGNIWAAVTECVESRQRKFLELSARGNFGRKDIVEALTYSEGEVEAAFACLTKSSSKPFLMRFWGAGEGVQNLDGAVAREDFNGRIEYPKKRNAEGEAELSDEMGVEYLDEDVEWDEEDISSYGEEEDISNEMRTPESDKSDYCDAFGPNTLERNVTSENKVVPFDIPGAKISKKSSFLSKLVAFRKDGKEKGENLSKFYDEACSTSESVNPVLEEEMHVKTPLLDASTHLDIKRQGPLNILKSTLSLVKDSMSAKAEKKLHCSIPERRTIVVRGEIARESMISDSILNSAASQEQDEGKTSCDEEESKATVARTEDPIRVRQVTRDADDPLNVNTNSDSKLNVENRSDKLHEKKGESYLLNTKEKNKCLSPSSHGDEPINETKLHYKDKLSDKSKNTVFGCKHINAKTTTNIEDFKLQSQEESNKLTNKKQNDPKDFKKLHLASTFQASSPSTKESNPKPLTDKEISHNCTNHLLEISNGKELCLGDKMALSPTSLRSHGVSEDLGLPHSFEVLTETESNSEKAYDAYQEKPISKNSNAKLRNLNKDKAEENSNSVRKTKLSLSEKLRKGYSNEANLSTSSDIRSDHSKNAEDSFLKNITGSNHTILDEIIKEKSEVLQNQISNCEGKRNKCENNLGTKSDVILLEDTKHFSIPLLKPPVNEEITELNSTAACNGKTLGDENQLRGNNDFKIADGVGTNFSENERKKQHSCDEDFSTSSSQLIFTQEIAIAQSLQCAKEELDFKTAEHIPTEELQLSETAFESRNAKTIQKELLEKTFMKDDPPIEKRVEFYTTGNFKNVKSKTTPELQEDIKQTTTFQRSRNDETKSLQRSLTKHANEEQTEFSDCIKCDSSGVNSSLPEEVKLSRHSEVSSLDEPETSQHTRPDLTFNASTHSPFFEGDGKFLDPLNLINDASANHVDLGSFSLGEKSVLQTSDFDNGSSEEKNVPQTSSIDNGSSREKNVLQSSTLDNSNSGAMKLPNSEVSQIENCQSSANRSIYIMSDWSLIDKNITGGVSEANTGCALEPEISSSLECSDAQQLTLELSQNTIEGDFLHEISESNRINNDSSGSLNAENISPLSRLEPEFKSKSNSQIHSDTSERDSNPTSLSSAYCQIEDDSSSPSKDLPIGCPKDIPSSDSRTVPSSIIVSELKERTASTEKFPTFHENTSGATGTPIASITLDSQFKATGSSKPRTPDTYESDSGHTKHPNPPTPLGFQFEAESSQTSKFCPAESHVHASNSIRTASPSISVEPQPSENSSQDKNPTTKSKEVTSDTNDTQNSFIPVDSRSEILNSYPRNNWTTDISQNLSSDINDGEQLSERNSPLNIKVSPSIEALIIDPTPRHEATTESENGTEIFSSSETQSLESDSRSYDDNRRSSTTPAGPVDALRSRFEGLMDATPRGLIRPQSPYRRMSFNSRKAAIALERQRDQDTEKKPWFIRKNNAQPAKIAVPKRSIKQQLEMERRVRKLVCDRKCRTYRKAEIVVQLLDLNFEEAEALQAAEECSTLDKALSYLQQECLLCAGLFAVSQIISMVHCQHKACRDCIRAYFTVQIRDRSIMELLCPFCNEPDIGDEDIAQDYFNHLDMMLKTLVDPEIHELFQRKLRDRVLMRDPNFKWCSQCSSGFISMPNLKRLICPDCNAVTCALCRRLWEPEHQGISCEAFAIFKDSTDPEAQAVGLAKLITEDGIDCPNCHFRYALAKGGCMHFRCIQCQHDFCSGCSRPFKMGQKCGVSEFCAKLGLHAHHPRNCLFYLRDKDPEDLQRLLDLSGIPYDRHPPAGVEVSKTCQVLEQKETTEGMIDDCCGKEVEEGFAGLCKTHYVEYLGQIVNKEKVDPIQIFENDDLELVLRRANIRLPPKRYRESEAQYREKLVKLIQEELPLDKMDGS